ncbi:MAG: antibiotic biosynthesis monooxygenase [Actinobacteria bacterium]|nr:antibiotic biosynthesis monooxygenase [Actinomycetota bacterium]
MTVIKINAITVPEDSGDELARRFAARAGAVDGQDGFEGFELLKPTDGRTTWLVVTRWRDEPAFEAWLSSPAFGQGHRGGGGSGPHGGPPHGAGAGATDAGVAGAGATDATDAGVAGAGAGAAGGGGHPHGGEAPVAVASELWSYEIAGGSQPRPGAEA